MGAVAATSGQAEELAERLRVKSVAAQRPGALSVPLPSRLPLRELQPGAYGSLLSCRH